MHLPSKTSKYAIFHFHGILGIKGSLLTIIGVKSQKWSRYTITICVDITKIKNGKMYCQLLPFYDFCCWARWIYLKLFCSDFTPVFDHFITLHHHNTWKAKDFGQLSPNKANERHILLKSGFHLTKLGKWPKKDPTKFTLGLAPTVPKIWPPNFGIVVKGPEDWMSQLRDRQRWSQSLGCKNIFGNLADTKWWEKLPFDRNWIGLEWNVWNWQPCICFHSW